MRKKVHKPASGVTRLVPYVLLLFASFVIVAVRYKEQLYENTRIEELIFYLFNGVKGTGSESFIQAFYDNTIYLIIIFLLLCLPIIDFYRDNIILLVRLRIRGRDRQIHINPSRIKMRYKVGYSFIVFILAIGYGLQSVGFVAYYKSLHSTSELIDKEYVDPQSTTITMPAKKRNLVYIHLESVENTLFSKNAGGASQTSIIPELESLALDSSNVSFSNSNKLGGAIGLASTSWTAGSMTAQMLGTPLKTIGGLDGNQPGRLNAFMPGAYGIGDVLAKEGYNQMLLVGSDISFGGRDKLYQQHGNFTLFDVKTARERGLIGNDYNVWWGYEDKKLFNYAKEELVALAKKDAPFNFQLLTADTHPVDGYSDETCPIRFGQQYKDVFACSSAQVAAFVDWMKAQDFYDNTTIVITGDHGGMQTVFFDEIIGNNDYERATYNLIINSLAKPQATKKRLFSQLDMYPTTLAALGANIEGNRLALGVNLFSNERTLVEKYGKDYLNMELAKRSKFYFDKIMLNK